jgi:hypothetical protein
VKVHGFGTAPLTNALPDVSWTAFEIVAVYVALGGRLLAGVKVATLFAAL